MLTYIRLGRSFMPFMFFMSVMLDHLDLAVEVLFKQQCVGAKISVFRNFNLPYEVGVLFDEAFRSVEVHFFKQAFTCLRSLKALDLIS